MAKNEDDSLLGLFSTKKSQPAGAVVAPPKPDTANHSEPHNSERSESVKAPPPAPAKPTRAPMTAAAKRVLKEARRELGNQETTGELDISEKAVAKAVNSVCETLNLKIDDVTKADIIIHLKRDLLGWGVLQELIDDPEVTDIHCYDHQTVVLQRGKQSELTGISWPTHEAYSTFIDRVLYRLGKSLSTQAHTVDASFPDGKRICAVHKSVCGDRGPLVTIRVPRVQKVDLMNLVNFRVAPPLIVNYLAALTRTCEHTFIIAGETGTGKTTLMRCLGTQFRPDESVIGVEDTPELNYQHPFYRSLVSRPANTEGVGEVTLQEHIKTTLRLCPSRVILGEMRTPEAAEAFLESAQTGHSGMATVHARNAKETLTRLESLLGRAQRGVAMGIIRQQIALAVSVVIWMTREKRSGRVRVGEICEVGHYVEGTIQVRPMFRLAQEGDEPSWEVQSWSSNFEEDLHNGGIHLGSAPKYVTFAENDESLLVSS